MRLFHRSAASILALLVACPAPNIWAAATVNPVVTRGPAAGVVTPRPVLPIQHLSGMSLGSLSNLSAPTINPALSGAPQVSAIPRLAAPTLPAQAIQVLAGRTIPKAVQDGALPGIEFAAAPETRAEAKLGAISLEVNSLLEAAGPLQQAAPESAQGLGAEVFKALLQEDAAPAEAAPAAQPAAQALPNLTQQKMLHSLYQVAAIFAEQYAPIEWKKQQFGVDLRREYDKAKAAILADPAISTRQFQDLLYSLTAAMKDYHVSIFFHSTERARLHFTVTEAGGKYYLAHIDRTKLPLKAFPFSIGDEVIMFDNQSTEDAVRAIAAEKGANTSETDLRLAEIFLTNRRRARGDQDIPQKNVVLGIKRAKDGKLLKIHMPWDYTPELIPQDVPVRDAGLLTPETPAETRPEYGLDDLAIAPQAKSASLKSLLARAFDQAVTPLARIFADMRAEAAENPFMMGVRRSYVPKLGHVTWLSKKDDPFHAYIFKLPDGRKAGFVRIPSYDGGKKEGDYFGKLMARFNQADVQVLVIDQVNNPGGAIFYLDRLVSHLTDKPLKNPRHQLIINEGDAQWAADLLLRIMQPQAEKKASPKKAAADKEDGEDEWAGYPITQKFVRLMVQFAQFILKQFDAGKRFTDPTHLWGVDDIDPAPQADQRFTGPILLLTNALDFSGGDFFPAILQDNKRATIMGVRTAGAGGAVKPFSLPNQFGIADLAATWTIAQRADGKPIENLGVTPDIPYAYTEKDLRTNFSEFKQAILKAIAGVMAADETRRNDPARKAVEAQHAQAKADIQTRLGTFAAGPLAAALSWDGQEVGVSISHDGKALSDPGQLAGLVASGELSKAQLEAFMSGLEAAAQAYEEEMAVAEAEYQAALQGLPDPAPQPPADKK